MARPSKEQNKKRDSDHMLQRNERRFAADREFSGPLSQRKLNGDYSGYNPLEQFGGGIGEQGFSGTGYDREGQHFGKGPKGWRRSDEMIREEACEALYHDSHVDASNIEVTVKDSCVHLKGSVENRQEKRRAEECVEKVSGVEDVQNELRLSSSMTSSTTGIDRSISSKNQDSNQSTLS